MIKLPEDIIQIDESEALSTSILKSMRPNKLLEALVIWDLGEKITALKQLPVEQSFSAIEIPDLCKRESNYRRLPTREK